MNRLGDSGVHTLGDTSVFLVNLAGQLLLTRRGKTKMDGVGIVFEFYIAPIYYLPLTNPIGCSTTILIGCFDQLIGNFASFLWIGYFNQDIG